MVPISKSTVDTGDSSSPILSMELDLSLGLEDIELDGGLGALFSSDDARLRIPSSEFVTDTMLPDTAMTAAVPQKADQPLPSSGKMPLKLPSNQENCAKLCSRSKLEIIGTNGVPLKKRSRRTSWEWMKDFQADCSEMVMMNPSLFMDDTSSNTKLEMIGNEDQIVPLNECFRVSSNDWAQDFKADTAGMGPVTPSLFVVSSKQSPKLEICQTAPVPIQHHTPTKGEKRKKKKRRTRVLDESRAIEPTDDDILFGRGGFTNIHPGNNRFRQKALDLWPTYKCSSKREKEKITNSLVESIKSKGCRFLEKGKDGLWHEVVNGDRRKASQTFRDIARRAH